MFNDIAVLVTGIISLVAGGGWFIHWRLNRNLKDTEAAVQRAEFYTKMIDDLENRVLKLQCRVLELESQCDNCELKKKLKE